MFKELDPLLHSRLRLSIMSFLKAKKGSDFTEIKSLTKATSGNISVQLKKLADAKYIKIKKGYKENYHHTQFSIKKTGITQFDKYRNRMNEYLKY